MRLGLVRSSLPVPYREALKFQRDIHSRRVRQEFSDLLWLLEHPPVITTGIRRNQQANIRVDPVRVGVELVGTERGGEVTYHGPGQLIGYLFVGIERFGFKVKDFVHRLEGAFVSYLSDKHGIHARQDSDYTGVWVGMEKITAIGIALRDRVTLHGFAFNVGTDLSHFDWIVPCGIAGRGVTSLEMVLGSPVSVDEVAVDVGRAVAAALGYEGIEEHSQADIISHRSSVSSHRRSPPL